MTQRIRDLAQRFVLMAEEWPCVRIFELQKGSTPYAYLGQGTRCPRRSPRCSAPQRSTRWHWKPTMTASYVQPLLEAPPQMQSGLPPVLQRPWWGLWVRHALDLVHIESQAHVEVLVLEDVEVAHRGAAAVQAPDPMPGTGASLPLQLLATSRSML